MKSISEIDKLNTQNLVGFFVRLFRGPIDGHFSKQFYLVDRDFVSKISEINQPKSVIERTMCFFHNKTQEDVTCIIYKLSLHELFAQISIEAVKSLVPSLSETQELTCSNVTEQSRMQNN